MKTHEDWMALWFMLGMFGVIIVGSFIAMWLAGYTVLRARAKDKGMTYDEYLAYLRQREQEQRRR